MKNLAYQEDFISIPNQEWSQICNKSNGTKAFMFIWFLLDAQDESVKRKWHQLEALSVDTEGGRRTWTG